MPAMRNPGKVQGVALTAAAEYTWYCCLPILIGALSGTLTAALETHSMKAKDGTKRISTNMTDNQ